MEIPICGLTPLLHVFDIPTSILLYRHILGMEIDGSSGQGDDVEWVLLSLNRTKLMLNTAYGKPVRPPKPDPARIAVHASLYFDGPDIAMFDDLRGKGLDLKPPKVAPYKTKQLYPRDPDNYIVCFQWPDND